MYTRLRTLATALKEPIANASYLTAIFGTSEIDGWKLPTVHTSRRIKQLATDLQTLHFQLPETERCIETEPTLYNFMVPKHLQWLKQLDSTTMTNVLTYTSTSERSSNIKSTASNIPAYQCPNCTSIFDTFGKLQTHRWRAHNTRNIYRQLVTSNICPLCNLTYISKRICQAHITKVCGPHATDQTIRLLTESVVGRKEEREVGKVKPTTSSSTAATPGPQTTQNIKVLLARTAKRQP